MIKNILSLIAFALLGAYALAGEIQLSSAVKKDTPIANAEVIFQKAGETSIKTTSNAQGKVIYNGFSDIESSDTIMLVKKSGFSTLVAKCPCNGSTYALSPNMQSLDGFRVVLTWGSIASDLDSHISYLENHIYRGSKIGLKANLDVDNATGFGPETITINQKLVGKKYIYAVHDYTNGTNPNSNKLSDSGATVNVYIGQTLIRTYRPTPNQVGNIWVVFGIDENGVFEDFDFYMGTSKGSNGVISIMSELVNELNFHAITRTPRTVVSQSELLNQQGEQQYHQGNLEEAMYLFQDAINIYSKNYPAYINLGLTYQKLGRKAEALWANRQVIN